MKRHRGWGKAVNRQPLFRLFVGVDWASQVHTISILEGNRKEFENKAYPHTGAGLHQLANPFVELSVGPPRGMISPWCGPVSETRRGRWRGSAEEAWRLLVHGNGSIG
jgi:hypothetical protein